MRTTFYPANFRLHPAAQTIALPKPVCPQAPSPSENRSYPAAIHFKALWNLQEQSEEVRGFYDIAASSNSEAQLGLIKTIHARNLKSREEAALQADLLGEIAKSPDEAVQQAVLKEAASWQSYLDYEAEILDALARHGTNDVRLGVVKEIARWTKHYTESAQVLRTAAEFGNRTVQLAVIKEIGRWQSHLHDQANVLEIAGAFGDESVRLAVVAEISRWKDNLPLQAQVLKSLLRHEESAVNKAVIKEVKRWNSSYQPLVTEVLREMSTPWINGPTDHDYISVGFEPGQPLWREDIKQARQKWTQALGRANQLRLAEICSVLDTLEQYVLD